MLELGKFYLISYKRMLPDLLPAISMIVYVTRYMDKNNPIVGGTVSVRLIAGPYTRAMHDTLLTMIQNVNGRKDKELSKEEVVQNLFELELRHPGRVIINKDWRKVCMP